MLTKLRSHLTYANVTATIAVFVALGGTSVAAVALKKNSVGSRQIKAGAVKGTELAKSAVTSTKVKDRSLLSKDFKTGQLPRGATGATGPQGTTGRSGVSGYRLTVSKPIANNAGDTTSGDSPSCTAGKKILGGGVLSTVVGTYVMRSYPVGDHWSATMRNTSGANSTFTVYATCAIVRE